MSWRPVPPAILGALLLVIPAPAGASPPQRDLAACEEKLARPDGPREAARCLYEVATGTGGQLSAGAGRLRELAARHPENPWFPIYLGKVRWQTRDLKTAEELYVLAAALAVRQGMAEAELHARWNLCRILRDAGRLEEGTAEVERAAAAARASGLPVLRLRADILRSLHWYAGGEFEPAYATLTRIRADVESAAERAREEREGYLLLRDHLFTLAKVAQEVGRFDEALQAFRRVAERAVEAGEPALEAQARYGMAAARLYEATELPSEDGRREVLELARSALAAASASGWSFMEMQPLWMLGFLGEPEQAREHLERCFAVAATPGERSSCRNALARRLARTDPRRAEEALRESLALARESGLVQVQTAFWSHRMRVSWMLNPPGKALEDSEAALDAIEALRDQQAGGKSQPGLFSAWAEHYYWLSGRLLETGQIERAFEVVERMRSRTLIDGLGLGLDRADPASAAVRFVSLRQVRAALRPDEALLSFQVAPWKDLAGDFGGGAWLLVSTRGGTRVHRLPGRTEVRPAVTAFTGLFEARDGADARGASVLYGKLLAAALAELPPEVRRLVIVADDLLHRLPFAALRPAPDAGPLTARYEIAMAPSATLWLHWRKARPSPAAMPVLVLADPPTRLGRLPYARTEGKAVMRHLGGGELLVGKEASEAYVKRHGAGPSGLVHFAAHAVTDEVDPERSFVSLSPGDGKEDGLLQAREIVNLDLDGRVVVLSTCESASGGILRGEGVMGLARAFFQAGAHTVVASLWPLRDDDGAALFDRFYRHLSRGKSVAAALQAAQRDRMAAGAPAAAWAGVVVLGDGDRIPVPDGRKPRMLPWTLGLVAASVLSYAARRRLRTTV